MAGGKELNQKVAGGSSAILLSQVSQSYQLRRQTVTALRDISLSIRQGEFVAITGESGSGKSTMLRLIGALEKPSAGQVYINGQDIAKLNDNQLSQLRSTSIGFVFQAFHLQPFLSVVNNVVVPTMFAGQPYNQARDKARQTLYAVGLDEKIDALPSELSGGQAQRVAICRAIINRPNILLADEPTGNLDSANSRTITDIFHQINRQLGTTVVIVTHNQQIAGEADRVIELRDGAIVRDTAATNRPAETKTGVL